MEEYVFDQEELFKATVNQLRKHADCLQELADCSRGLERRDISVLVRFFNRDLEVIEKVLDDSKKKKNFGEVVASRKKPVQIDHLKKIPIAQQRENIGSVSTDFIKWYGDRQEKSTYAEKFHKPIVFKSFFGNKKFGAHLFSKNPRHVAQEAAFFLIPILPCIAYAIDFLENINLSNRAGDKDELPAPVIISNLSLFLRNRVIHDKLVSSRVNLSGNVDPREYGELITDPQNILIFSADQISDSKTRYGKDSKESVRALFDNSYAAFLHAKKYAEEKNRHRVLESPIIIKTGLLGAGELGNKPEFSIFMQYLAARLVGVNLIEFYGVPLDRVLVAKDIMNKVDEILAEKKDIIDVDQVIVDLLNGKIFGDKTSKAALSNPAINPMDGWFDNYNYGEKIKSEVGEPLNYIRVLKLKESIKFMAAHKGNEFTFYYLPEYGSLLNIEIDTRDDSSIKIKLGAQLINLETRSWKEKDEEEFSLLEDVIEGIVSRLPELQPIVVMDEASSMPIEIHNGIYYTLPNPITKPESVKKVCDNKRQQSVS